jgi:hypothetical protein
MDGRRYGDTDLEPLPTLQGTRGTPLTGDHRCLDCGRSFRLAAGLGRHLEARTRGSHETRQCRPVRA